MVIRIYLYILRLFKRFYNRLNVVEVTHVWLLIGTSFASLTRNECCHFFCGDFSAWGVFHVGNFRCGHFSCGQFSCQQFFCWEFSCTEFFFLEILFLVTGTGHTPTHPHIHTEINGFLFLFNWNCVWLKKIKRSIIWAI